MGGQDDKEQAEKLAAAKKRVAQLKKKKAAAASATKSTKDDSKKAADAAQAAEAAEADAPDGDKEVVDEDAAAFDAAISQANNQPLADADADAKAVPDAADAGPDTSAVAADDDETTLSPGKTRGSARQPSVSLQSQLRSNSFRVTAPSLLGTGTPGTGTTSSLQRIEELERENQRLSQEAAEHEARWRRTEEELEELRESNSSSSPSSNAEISRLRAELDLLKRQSQSAHRASSASEGVDSLRKQVESKDSVIADLQLEISRLRSQLSVQASSSDEHGSQISGLTASIAAAEAKVLELDTKLADSKQALARASEKAVLDGTAHASKDGQIHALQRDLDTTKAQSADMTKKVDQLEKKIEAMNKLHRESEARSAARLSAAEHVSRDLPVLRAKVATLEAENAKLREKNRRALASADAGADADGLDELEDEERGKLASRIRELEAEVFELQRGLWRDRRSTLQSNLDATATTAMAGLPRRSVEVAAEGFDEVDLSGSPSFATSSYQQQLLQQQQQHQQQKHSNLSQYISSGLQAFLPLSATSPPPLQGSHAARARNDSLLQDFDGDDDANAVFDEAAFAQAQREEEAKKMLLHVREVKSGLTKNWRGWRLDLVDLRSADAGPWPIFDV